MTKLKITVVKTFTTEELYGEDAPSTVESFSNICPIHSPGQEYVTDSVVCPEGLCTWAYADMRREIKHLLRGGDFYWIGKKGVAFSSCTDGLRNVVFKIERI